MSASMSWRRTEEGFIRSIYRMNSRAAFTKIKAAWDGCRAYGFLFSDQLPGMFLTRIARGSGAA
jgi:hypothetical protein